MSRTVPTMATIIPGNFVTSAWEAANVAALGNFALGVPVFSGYQTVAQSIANITFTSFLLDTETIDSDGGHSTVTNTSRYTATVPGTYLVVGTSGWATNATGFRRVRIALNGVAIPGSCCASDASVGSNDAGHCTTTLAVMNGTTDYVEVQGDQASGGALNTDTNSGFGPSMRLFWVSR